MRMKTCCFTGHRIIPPEVLPKLSSELESTLHILIQNGICYFGTGGALGFDTLAAETVLQFKTQYPHIRLILVLPCLDQTKGWPPESIQHYQSILRNADKVVYTSQYYFRGCMHQRNRHLVDCSSICIAYCNRSTGGSAYTVRYAQRQGLKVIYLAKKN